MLLPQTELTVYSNQINLTLLNDIVAFVLSSSEATYGQKRALSEHCFLLDPKADSSTFQQKYGFLYFGELLERYEERFHASIQDIRAIALALGCTRDIVTDSMFVGTQRADFIRRLTRQAGQDLYLTGALYLLNQESGKSAELESKLLRECSATEELIFAICLLHDKEYVFSQVKTQLLRLLSGKRTLAVLGNMRVLNWLITWLVPYVKSVRGKDMALFRALSALAVSFVKAGSKHHAVLMEHGYTPLEIAYANMMTVVSQTADGVLPTGSIVTQKIVVALFQEVLGWQEPLPPDVYALLSEIFRQFAKFHIRCYGCKRLEEALNTAPCISNTETLLWFSKLVGIHHSVFCGFDILDRKWDALASTLDSELYLSLFELGLSDSLSTDDIQARINRYDTLTGTSYLSVYRSKYGGIHFNLLVKRGIIDLWRSFQAGLDHEGTVICPDAVDRILHYVYNLCGIQAYQFYEKLINTYGIQSLKRFFANSYYNFYSALVSKTNYSNRTECTLTLNIERDFLDDDQHRQILMWLEEYVFLNCPQDYLPFVTAILCSTTTAELFSQEDQRTLFEVVITQTGLLQGIASSLKQRYLTEEEKMEEQKAEEAAKQKAKQEKMRNLSMELQNRYAEQSDGTFSYDKTFLERYSALHDSERISAYIVAEHLSECLAEPGRSINSSETAHFLSVCAILVKRRLITFQEIQNYILRIKGCDDYAGNPS